MNSFYTDTTLPELPKTWAHGRAGYGIFRSEEVESDAVTPKPLRKIHLGLDLTYGLPSEPERATRGPLDHFDLRTEVDLAEKSVVGSLFMRGLVVGESHRTPSVTGMWGLYATHDFYTPVGLRVGAFGLGPGATLEFDLGGEWFLQWTAITGFVPIGAMGYRESTGLRDYQFGPGGSELLEFRVGRANLGMLQLTSRNVSLDVPLQGPARTVSQNSSLALFQVWRKLGVGAEVTATVATELQIGGASEITDVGVQARGFVTILSDSKFGSGKR